MNYTELQTEIADWLDRAETSIDIPTLITKAENRLNRKLRLLQMRELSEETFSSGSRFLAFPTGFLELLDLDMRPSTSADTAYTKPIYVAPEMISQYYASNGTPTYFTVRDQFEFNCEVNANHVARVYYLKKWDIETDTTNWLLTNFEEAYVYGSLVAAEMYLKNDERMPMWKATFNEVMTELNDLDERSTDDAILGTDVYELHNRSYYNVITDRG